jgi:hypothetical protein
MARRPQCDLVRPSCGRCSRRRIECIGFPSDQHFIFRDENAVAQRNSQRARRGRGYGSQAPSIGAGSDDSGPSGALNFDQQMQLSTAGPSRTGMDMELDISGSPGGSEQDEAEEAALARQFAWLNEQALATVPEPLRRDLDQRAVDRFFVNWTLYPRNDGFSASGGGYMPDLYSLHERIKPSSVLWLAVRAVAFADMARTNVSVYPGGGAESFQTKARRHYGAALAKLRQDISDPEKMRCDCVLAALLLIDNFEVVYLGRDNPIGPHSEAVRHMLNARGEEQFLSRTKFRWWQVASQHLIQRLLLLGEPPDRQLLAWMGKLNANLPDNRIWSDALQMIALNAETKAFLDQARRSASPDDSTSSHVKLSAAQALVGRIQSLLDETDAAVTAMATDWRPIESDPEHMAPPDDGSIRSSSPIPDFPCPIYLRYSDIWIAHVWNLHAAAQIFLRETLVDLINLTMALRRAISDPRTSSEKGKGLTTPSFTPDPEASARIAHQRHAISRLSTAIVESYPPLLGWKYRDRGIAPYAPPQGKMAGRLFSLSSMWVVRSARMTSGTHKRVAGEVIDWINSHHVLSDSQDETPISRGFDVTVEAGLWSGQDSQDQEYRLP